MRIYLKLCFSKDEKQWENIWFFVDPSKVNTISELIYAIYHELGLKNQAPHGLTLQVEGARLLPSQPLSIIENKDIIW